MTEKPRQPPFKVIGYLESCFQEKFATPRQPQLAPGAHARLRILPEFLPEHSLKGLEGFSHVWLVTWMHLCTSKSFLPMVHPPRLRGAKQGVFATRSPHRPNPIGLSLARLGKIEGDTLHLYGLDLVDGTPVLDLKPYLPDADHAPGASGGWTEKNEFPRLKVEFSARAEADLAGAPADLRRLIEDVLSHDPRNHRDRAQMAEGFDMGFFVCGRDVHFSVKAGTATVLYIDAEARFVKKFRRQKPAS